MEKAEKPIKLVLKVGSSQDKISAKPDTPSSTSRPSMNLDKTKSKDHSSKKKKKKRSASRERKKPKFDAGSSVSINYVNTRITVITATVGVAYSVHNVTI